MLQLADSHARQQALTPNQSFIVQAPAGSGKTTLLTQRFLCLLTYVQQPEEILAITFTKKAAHEMQTRVRAALEFGTLPKPEEPQQSVLWQLAQEALAQDAKFNWQLLNNPNRLQIKTIDSLCHSLTKFLPLLAKFGAEPQTNPTPEPLYQQAVEALFEELKEKTPWQTYLKTLLLHLDNNLQKAATLLIDMLAKRDHWLPLIIHHQTEEELRNELEQGLQAINNECLQRVEKELQQVNVKSELFTLINFAANYNSELACWLNLSNFPTTTVENKVAWLTIAELLITKDCVNWRTTVTKAQGFPAAKTIKDKDEALCCKAMKEQMLTLLTSLHNKHSLFTALIDLKNTPSIRYTDSQWQILYALLRLLPVLCAYLRLVFRKTGEVDFTEMMLASLLALGSETEPTDLALSLDYKIKHLLVDEFQDTSLSQLRLLEKLTAHWQQEDGRSLFLVGDPMQSIYRFRNAEVSLFLQCKQQGINQLQLNPLTLTTNFRSEPRLVEWFNTVFAKVFPKQNNPTLGAISYTASTTLKAEQTCKITYELALTDRLAEANYIVELIKKLQAENPLQSIAILVQARGQLAEILPTLNQTKIKYQGIELATLSEQSHIQDLLALTKAIHNLADRTAWLAILRAPWCGLTLADLLAISQTNSKQIIWQRLHEEDLLTHLPETSRKRLAFFKRMMTAALASKFRKPLANIVKETWEDLGGKALFAEAHKQQDCQIYLQYLANQELAGDLQNLIQFEAELNCLYAEPLKEESIRLFIMTIHKAKGLEYDIVIIPSLEYVPKNPKQQLMVWAELPQQQQIHTLLAPLKASNENKHDSIYQYLSLRETQCEAEERKRLFYVAVTRAKSQLYLLACEQERAPATNSFLYYLQTIYPLSSKPALSKPVIEPILTKEKQLVRLSLEQLQQQASARPIIHGHNQVSVEELIWQPAKENLLGSFIHRLLQQIAKESLERWNNAYLQQQQKIWQTSLLQLGIHQKDIEACIETVYQAIHNILHDEMGRWILSSHPQAYSELALSTTLHGKVKQFYIDRVIIDQHKQLWLIDFKTTFINNHYPENLISLLLSQEKNTYREQLLQYQKIVQQYFGQTPRYGLYFTSLPTWLECTEN